MAKREISIKIMVVYIYSFENNSLAFLTSTTIEQIKANTETPITAYCSSVVKFSNDS